MTDLQREALDQLRFERQLWHAALAGIERGRARGVAAGSRAAASRLRNEDRRPHLVREDIRGAR